MTLYDLYPYTAQKAIILTLGLTLTAIVVSCVEWLYKYKIYAPGGWLYWEYLRPCRRIYTSSPLIGRLADIFFAYPAVLGLICGRLLLAGWLMTDLLRGSAPPALIMGLCIAGLLVHLRNQYSNNGSDQLSNIILVAASIGSLPSSNQLILCLSVFFVACQSALSYVTSGFLKLLTADWRNGTSLRGIFSTAAFGHPWVNRLLGDRPAIYTILSLGVIFLEIFMGFSMALPPPVCAMLPIAGVLLHLTIAFTMGLNNFLWTFPATYPCLYFICLKLHQHAF